MSTRAALFNAVKTEEDKFLRVKEIIDELNEDVLTREYELVHHIFKVKYKKSLRNSFNDLKDGLSHPATHIMESPARHWAEFRDFINHIDF